MHHFILIIIFYQLIGSALWADEIRPASLQVKALDAQSYDVTWKVPAKKSGERLALHLFFDKKVQDLKKPVGVYVAGYYVQNWRVHAKDGLANSTVHIDGLASSSTEVLLRYINEKGEVISGRITPSTPQYTFKKSAGRFDTVKTYTKLGIEHILEGTDHLLFVACLVMIASTFSKLLWTITGFTLAHSVTLFLSALNLLHVPIPPIEASIALSIIFLALEIVKNNKNSLTYRYPVVVSSSFGLLHGFGFASALKEIGLPQSERVTALLFFNVGVEIGQLIFVAFLLLGAWVIHKIVRNALIVSWEKIVGYIVGTIATFWFFQRLMVF